MNLLKPWLLLLLADSLFSPVGNNFSPSEILVLLLWVIFRPTFFLSVWKENDLWVKVKMVEMWGSHGGTILSNRSAEKKQTTFSAAVLLVPVTWLVGWLGVKHSICILWTLWPWLDVLQMGQSSLAPRLSQGLPPHSRVNTTPQPPWWRSDCAWLELQNAPLFLW